MPVLPPSPGGLRRRVERDELDRPDYRRHGPDPGPTRPEDRHPDACVRPGRTRPGNFPLFEVSRSGRGCPRTVHRGRHRPDGGVIRRGCRAGRRGDQNSRGGGQEVPVLPGPWLGRSCVGSCSWGRRRTGAHRHRLLPPHRSRAPSAPRAAGRVHSDSRGLTDLSSLVL